MKTKLVAQNETARIEKGEIEHRPIIQFSDWFSVIGRTVQRGIAKPGYIFMVGRQIYMIVEVADEA